ncbi:MAG: hypothetical protein PVF83_19945 [Anaerolineales bacterium]|jgi:hypothetical protein
MAVYKVSVVVTKSEHPGAILNMDEAPEVGKTISLGKEEFVILEVFELMPPRGDFFFLHATCVPKE